MAGLDADPTEILFSHDDGDESDYFKQELDNVPIRHPTPTAWRTSPPVQLKHEQEFGTVLMPVLSNPLFGAEHQ